MVSLPCQNIARVTLRTLDSYKVGDFRWAGRHSGNPIVNLDIPQLSSLLVNGFAK